MLTIASEHDRELYQRQTARPAFAEWGVDATDREIDKLVASRELPQGADGGRDWGVERIG